MYLQHTLMTISATTAAAASLRPSDISHHGITPREGAPETDCVDWSFTVGSMTKYQGDVELVTGVGLDANPNGKSRKPIDGTTLILNRLRLVHGSIFSRSDSQLYPWWRSISVRIPKDPASSSQY